MKNNFKWTSERKILAGLILVLTILTIVGVRSINHFSENKTENISKTVSTTYVPLDPIILVSDKKQLDILKKNFDYKYDEFQKVGWYTHKNQNPNNSWNRNFLQVHVNSIGYAYLESDYYGDDWIFHTKVQVKIGDNIYESADVPMYDHNNVTNNGSGSVWENVSYVSDGDNGIIKAIAESGDLPVKVRFVGRESIKDITLSKKDQQAIKDSYELARLITEINEN